MKSKKQNDPHLTGCLPHVLITALSSKYDPVKVMYFLNLLNCLVLCLKDQNYVLNENV